MKKMHTGKYTIYADTGQIYIGEKYFRTLTETQLHYLRSYQWGSAARKARLEKLIDGGDEAWEADQHLASRVTSALLKQASERGVSDCEHRWKYLDKLADCYMFFCSKCLDLDRVDKQ